MVPLLGLGLGVLGGIGQMFSRGKANREMDRLLKEDPIYKANPIAGQRMALAGQLLNARAPGASRAESNIFRNQSNTMYGAQRNATDSAQLLSYGANSQGQTNNALEGLQGQEEQDYQRRYGNYSDAQQGMINEDDKVFQDEQRRYNDKVQVRGAQQQNRDSNWQSFSNLGFGLGNFGLQGGFNGLMKKRSAAPIGYAPDFDNYGNPNGG